MDEVYYKKKKKLLVQCVRVKLIATVCLDASEQSNITTLDRIQLDSGIWLNKLVFSAINKLKSKILPSLFPIPRVLFGHLTMF